MYRALVQEVLKRPCSGCAIAVWKATSDAGVSTGMRSGRAAEKGALSKCSTSVAPDCWPT
ncbi:DUF4189 domain-containing protein [Stenotrophomonas forensis]